METPHTRVCISCLRPFLWCIFRRGCTARLPHVFVFRALRLTLLPIDSQGTKFSAFMEGFCGKVGIPADRTDESVFKFDGDKLNPDGTPEVRRTDLEPAVAAVRPAAIPTT